MYNNAFWFFFIFFVLIAILYVYSRKSESKHDSKSVENKFENRSRESDKIILIQQPIYYPVGVPTQTVSNPFLSHQIPLVPSIQSDTQCSPMQVGTLTNKQDQMILPLFMFPTKFNRDRKHYYTVANGSNGFIEVKIPVFYENRDCLDTNGCRELYTDDVIFIPQYNRSFNVNLYPKLL